MPRPQSPQPDAPKEHRCRTCGYNLRGLPSPICPECGTTFDPADPRTFVTHPPDPAPWAAFAECLPWILVEQFIALLLAGMILDTGAFLFCVLGISGVFWIGVIAVCTHNPGWPGRWQVLYLKLGLPILLAIGVPTLLMLID